MSFKIHKKNKRQLVAYLIYVTPREKENTSFSPINCPQNVIVELIWKGEFMYDL